MAIRGGRRPGSWASAITSWRSGPKGPFGLWLSRWNVVTRAALVASGIVILAISTSTGDRNHADWSDVGVGPTLACWLWAATCPVFRAPEAALPPVLRLRCRVRRSFHRAGVGAMTASLLLLTIDAVCTLHADNLASYDASERWSSWSHTALVWSEVTAATALMVPLLDAPAWWLWVRTQSATVRTTLRQGLIDGRAIKSVAEMTRRGNFLIGEKSASGRGRKQPDGTVTIRPVPDSAPRRSASRKRWYADGHLTWDETRLVASNGKGDPLTWPVTRGGIADAFDPGAVHLANSRPNSVGEASDAVVAIAAVTAATRPPTGTGRPTKSGENVVALLLLDAECRRLASLPFTGLRARDVSDLAQAAKIDFRTYQDWSASGELSATMNAYFPRSIHYRRLRGPRSRPTGWLSSTSDHKRP